MQDSDILRIAQALEKIADDYHMNSHKLQQNASRLGNGWRDLDACRMAVQFTSELCERAMTRFKVFPENVREGYELVESGMVRIGYVGYLAQR